MTSPDQLRRTGIVGPNHALLIGEVLGALMNAGFDVIPTVDGDLYRNELHIRRPSGTWRVTIEPEEVRET